jgi:hypothetical protein
MRKLFGILCAMLLSVGFVSHAPAFQATPKNAATIEARKRISEAQAVVTELKADEKRIKDKRRNEFETEKEEWKTTMATHKKRKEAYTLARNQALATAKAKPAYKTAVKNRAALQIKVDELSKQRNADSALITKTASKLTAEGFAIKKMETEAMEQDAKAIEAKELFEESEKDVKQLEEEVETSLATDPDYIALQTQLEQAETQLTQAKDALAQMQKSERASRPTPAPRKGKLSDEGL